VFNLLIACLFPFYSIPTFDGANFVFLLFNSQFVPAVSAGDTIDGSTRRTVIQLATYSNTILEDLINF
jgi:hypothetical protein